MPDPMAASTSCCPRASRFRKSRQEHSASFRPPTVALISAPTSARLPWSRAVSAISVAGEYASASTAQESMRPQWPLPSRNGWMAPCAKYAAAARASNARDSSAARASRRSTSTGISSGVAVCAPGRRRLPQSSAGVRPHRGARAPSAHLALPRGPRGTFAPIRSRTSAQGSTAACNAFSPPAF